MAELPEYLRARPARASDVPPPVRGRPQELPFDKISWQAFEQLSLRLFERERELVDFRLYGTAGQEQEGIDLYGVSADGQYATAQCRRVQSLTPASIRELVADFLTGDWAVPSGSLTLFTSASTRSTGVVDAIEEQRDVLASHEIAFTVRGAERLSSDLKDQPQIVDDFFGPDWRRAFCPGQDLAVGTELGGAAAREIAELAVAAARRPRLLALDSLHAAVQRAMRTLAEQKEDEVPMIEPVLADPLPAARAARWIAEPPPEIAGASWQLWVVLTRIAERGGEWTAGAGGWLRVAEIRRGDAGGGELRAVVNASIATGIGGDEERAAELLEAARRIDAGHPKVRLQDIGKIPDPADQLAALEGLSSDDEDEQTLIELNRALAYIQTNAFEEAERALRRAEGSGGARLTQLPIVRSNLTVQVNRIRASQGRPLDGRALEQAEIESLAARDTLMAERRFAESVRALMLAVDTVAMRSDFTGAEALLATATEEEIAAPDGSGVLGDAALRCLAPHLALRFVERAPNTDESRRINAAAKLAVRQDPDSARAELREIALQRGGEAQMAAFLFCRDAAFHGGPWDDEVADVLSAGSPVEALTLKAWHLARSARYDEARALLAARRNDRWALLLQFTLADLADHPDALELVPAVLASNPDRHQRLRCAGVLFASGPEARSRAEAEARLVAQDEAAPVAERSDGYHALLRILEVDQRWKDAQTELRAWVMIDPTDDRLNAWQVKVGNRLRRGN